MKPQIQSWLLLVLASLQGERGDDLEGRVVK